MRDITRIIDNRESGLLLEHAKECYTGMTLLSPNTHTHTRRTSCVCLMGSYTARAPEELWLNKTPHTVCLILYCFYIVNQH